MTLLERLKGWRTVIFNGVVAVAAVVTELVAYLAADTSWSEYLPRSWTVAAIVIINVANIFLRFITTSRVGRP